jgi:serine/threonine-protein kinase RsbW
MTLRRTFPCRPEAVTAARHFVRDSLAGQSPATLEAAELMTSELASNAVRHARSGFELVIRTGREIRIELHDDGGGAPTLLSPTPREVTGRGLLIVAAMSTDWGVIPSASGKQVWFTLPLAPERGDALRAVPAQRGSVARSSPGEQRRAQPSKAKARTPRRARPRGCAMCGSGEPGAVLARAGRLRRVAQCQRPLDRHDRHAP